MSQLKIRNIVPRLWNGQTENKIKMKSLFEMWHKNWEQQQYSGCWNAIDCITTTTRQGQLEVQAVKRSGQRAGWLVTQCQMDTTSCLNDFSLIYNWSQLWLSSLALPTVLRSAVGSRLGIHPAGSVQAPVRMTGPERAVGFLVMPSSSKFCLIHGVEHRHCHLIPLSFTFIFAHFSFSCQMLWLVTERHFLILVQDCWYFPPYAVLRLVNRTT